ncbi:zinc finger CW-type PWWP domain protein 1-like [Plodia interpunctella]|uniref:zinc finger CW-type PWWP domain protein 1-like n=1 Tax=Plodia interpunctella TaxID=58824 RepID=UPI002368D67D|nr:zinc finger CW-type PWWP domain protein 1-like [Plodia interpunctella]
MDNIKLPIENAQEPIEEASLPLNMKTTCLPAKSITGSQRSVAYKDVLSQPAPGLTQRQRLQWLQNRRNPGLYVQCDSCERWRYLPYVVDSHELPHKWYCKMNPDSSQASCSAPEQPIRPSDEEELIHSEYSAGSVVWARLPGWPWWPAMVDDCPDNEQFYWLDGFSDIPTHYNVVFFDAFEVTRAWIAPDQMKPYSTNKNSFKRPKDKRFKSRLEVALKQAKDADLLPLPDRLAKYSFIARYKGTINKPNKINKKVLEKFKKQLKRKLNIDFSDDESSDEDFIEPKETSKKKSNMNGNAVILGTPKRDRRNNIIPKVLNEAYNKEQASVIDKDNTDASVKVVEVANEKIAEQNKNNDLEPDSMTVQIGSSTVVQDSTTASTILANEPKETHDSEKTEQYEVRIPSSPISNDFDF